MYVIDYDHVKEIQKSKYTNKATITPGYSSLSLIKTNPKYESLFLSKANANSSLKFHNRKKNCEIVNENLLRSDVLKSNVMSNQSKRLLNEQGYNESFLSRKNCGTEFLSKITSSMSEIERVNSHLERTHDNQSNKIGIFPSTDDDKLSEEIWKNPYVQRRLEPFLQHLNAMSDISKFSLSQQLEFITDEKIPKYSLFTNLKANDHWELLKQDYNEIYIEMFNLYQNLYIEENKLVALSRQHQWNKIGHTKLKMQILNFKQNRRETWPEKILFKPKAKECKVIQRDIKHHNTVFPEIPSYVKVKGKIALKNYSLGWMDLDLNVMQIGNYQRKKNRSGPIISYDFVNDYKQEQIRNQRAQSALRHPFLTNTD